MLFTVAPAVLAVLIVVAMTAVIRANTHKNTGRTDAAPVADAGTSASTAGLSTAADTSTPASSSTPPPDNPALARQSVDATDDLGLSLTEMGGGILDRDSGQVTLGENGTTQFYCASVLKLFVITALLHDQEAGEVTLSGADLTNVTRALELSDDNAMDALWEHYSGPKLVTQMIALAHLQDTQLPSDLSQWGETLISARDVLSVYQYVFNSLDATDSRLVLNDLNHATPSGADGFNQSFGLLAPGVRTSTTKAKQGWMDYGDKTMMLHTTGVVGSQDQYVIAVLSLQRMSSGWAAGRSNINRATEALLGALGSAATS